MLIVASPCLRRLVRASIMVTPFWAVHTAKTQKLLITMSKPVQFAKSNLCGGDYAERQNGFPHIACQLPNVVTARLAWP